MEQVAAPTTNMTEEGSPLRLCCYIAYYAHFLEKSDDADADVIRAANDLPVEPRATGNSTFCTTVATTCGCL